MRVAAAWPLWAALVMLAPRRARWLRYGAPRAALAAVLIWRESGQGRPLWKWMVRMEHQAWGQGAQQFLRADVLHGHRLVDWYIWGPYQRAPLRHAR